MTLANPLLLVRDAAKRRHAPLSIVSGGVYFPLRSGQGIGCSLMKPSNTLCFRIAAPQNPLPRGNHGEVIRFLCGINRILNARGQFHTIREGRFSIHPGSRMPVYQAYLSNARKRSQHEVDYFLELMEEQFNQVYPLFVAAHRHGLIPNLEWVELALSTRGRLH